MKIITPEVIERARKLGACHEAITWISSCTHTTTELAQLKPNWAEWVIQNMATAPAREAYDKAMAPAWEAYDKAMAPAREAILDGLF